MNTSEWFKKEIEKLDKDIDSLTYKYVLDFSEKVYETLHRKGIKNKNKFLAERLNCSPAYITKIFNGKSNFTIKKMIEIANVIENNLEISLRPKLSHVLVSSDDKFNITARTGFRVYKNEETKEITTNVDAISHIHKELEAA